MTPAAYTAQDVSSITKDMSQMSAQARGYIEHVLGNGFMRIQQAATINPARVSEEIERIMQELIAVGFWEIRRVRGR